MSETAKLPRALAQRRLRPLNWVRAKEWAIRSGLLGATLFSILITVSIVCLLFSETLRFFQFERVSVSDFLTGTTWSPTLGEGGQFGIWPLISGTMMIA